jgi:hypothetical protein
LGVGEGPAEKELLRGFDLHVARGERVAIVGENGAGKSTLLKALLDKIPLLFTFGWSLVLTAVAFLLPGIWRKIYQLVSICFFGLLVLTHGILINIFRRFFTFADLSFADEATDFADLSYFVIRKLTILAVLVSVGLMVAAVRLAPRGKARRPRRALLAGLLAGVLGIAVIIGTAAAFLRPSETVRWDDTVLPTALYDSFSDTKKCLPLAGLYQYTFRDFSRTYLGTDGIGGKQDAAAVAALDSYFAGGETEPEETRRPAFSPGKT